MSNHGLGSRLLCCVMLCVLPTALMSSDQGAMLYGTGRVTVNARPVSRTAAVFAGDKIQTGGDASVTLAFQGTRVNMPANSSIVYQPNRIRMEYGRALFETKKGAGAELAGLSIRPAAASAKFQLTRTAKVIQVAALDGPLAVSDGLHTVQLSPGQEMSRLQPPANPQEPPAAGGKAASTAGTTTAPAPAVSGGIPGWVIAAAVATAAGGTVGGLAAAGTFSEENPPSPSQP